jgi:2-hydroxymuconate-semialdehyde hydrolase
MTRERVSVKGIGAPGELAVRVAGAGAPVLLIHGIPGSSVVWDRVVPGLVAAGHRVLVPDLLGFGDSRRPDPGEALWLGAQAAALSGVLEELAEGPAVVVGHDYGAPTSVILARRDPARVRGLVLAAGNLFTDTPIPGPLKALRVPGLSAVAARLMFSGPSLKLMIRLGCGQPRPAMDASAYVGDRRQQAAIRWIFATALGDLEARYREVEAALPTLEKPVVVLWGGRDPFFPLEEGRRAASAIPGAELVVGERAGHFLPAERPDLFREAVSRLRSRALEPG